MVLHIREGGREGRAGGELGVCLMNISVAYKCQCPKCE